MLAGKLFEENEMTIDGESREDGREVIAEEEELAAASSQEEEELTPEMKEAFDNATAAEMEGDDAGIAAWQEAWSVSPGHQEVVDALMRLFENTGKWPQLADFLKKNGNTLKDSPRKINVLMTLASLYDERMKQDVMVVNTYQAILKFKSDYLPAINAAIDKYESMERWPDLVKMMKLKGAAVTDPEEKVGVWLVVAKLFLNRFSNQAETIKAFEEVLAVDPYHSEALEFLKGMYEKRRDWEKLIGVMEKEIEQLDDESARIDGYLQIAQLASDRLKRPNICIERWEAVLNVDPENESALNELSSLYERAKEWEKLAVVLSRQLESVVDPAQQTQMLQKLGQVYGDRIGDNAKAIEAWKTLLEMNPNDRRAQEQLKKRYLAAQAWDDLEAFYDTSGKWDEFIRILEREADRDTTEVATKISMYFKVAELWSEKKSRTDRAASSYETILSLDPENLDAAELYIPILEEGKEPAKLADVLEVRLHHLEDIVDKIELTRRIATLAEEEIGDAGRAFKGFLSVFELSPEDEQSSEDMERLAGKTGEWETVVETYRSLLEDADDAASINLKLKIARILDDELNQRDDALKYYDEILTLDPKNQRAVAALEKLYAHMGRYEELLDIYARRLEMAEDDTERQEILYNQALLWEEEVKDNEKAITVLNQLIEMAGDDPRSLSSLDRLYLVEERWTDLSDVIRRQLDLGMVEPELELELKFRQGQVSEQHLNDRVKAMECYREILEVDPEYADAVSALEAMLDDEGQQAEAAKVLSLYYEEHEEWEKLVGSLEILVRHATDELERYELLIREGALYSENLMSPERAFVAYSRAFKQRPTEPEALERLEEITNILDSWSELVDLLAEGGQGTRDLQTAKDLWIRAARIYETQLDDVDKAVYAYNQAMAADPQNSESVAALEGIYNRTERWDELIEIYKTKVEITDDIEAKEQIYLQMSMIFEEMLDRPEDAITCLKEVLGFDPANMGALKELDKLFRQLERWTDLADNLQAQLSMGEDAEETIALNLRLAELNEKQLGQIGAAIEIYREVLNVDASNEKAIEALEGIIENLEFRRDVADILQPIYEALGIWEKLVNVYEIMVDTEDSAGRKVELLHQVAALWETEGDDPERAFTTFGRALSIDPAEDSTQEELERLARILVLYDDLAALYARIVDTIDTYDLKAYYHLKIARVFEDNLQDMDNAIKHYRAVLEVDPMHLEAATALEGAYQITENYEDLAIIYQKKVDIVADIEEQKDMLFKASRIYEEYMGNIDKAIEVYRRILEIDEDDLQAITQIEALYLKLERWDDLQEIYNKKVDLVETSEEKREVLYVLGSVYEQEVGDIDKAITTYQRVLEFDPDDVQSVHRLDCLYTQKEEWHDLLSILERRIELSGDPDEAISFQYRVGELYVRHLDDISRAVDYFREILTLSPDHEPSLAILEELIHTDEGAMLAAEVLEPIYHDMGEWRKLIEVLDVKLRHAESEIDKVELLHRIAEMMESDLYLDVPEEAFDVYARALAEDRTNERTLEKLEELASQTDRWKDLAMLMDKELEQIVDAEQAILIGLKAGVIYEEKLNDSDEAILRYRKVLEFDDQNREALQCLDRLFHIQERWGDLTEILEKEAAIAEDPEEGLELQFRMGQVYQQELQQIDKAIETYRDILAADPAHESSSSALEFLFAEGGRRTDIAGVLEPIYRMHSEWEKLVRLYEAQLEDIEDTHDMVSLMHRMAEIQEERALDAVEAFKWYCKAFSADPLNERSGEEVERLASAVDGWVELADLYQDLFLRNEDPGIKILCAKRLAVVAEEHLSDIARAEQAYRGCLDHGGDDLDVLTALDRIYTQYMEWERLAGILFKLAEIVPDVEEKIAYTNRLGAVYSTEIGDAEKARECFHRVIDEYDPHNSEALEHLEIVYADQEAWSELYEIYSHMKDGTDDEQELADLYSKLATISADCLNDIPQSTELWNKVLELRGEDTFALESLAELHARQENWSDLVEILDRAVTVAEDDETRVRIYSQLGLVWGECLQRDKNALENWENVLSIEPENMPALKAIAQIHEANKDWDQLLNTLDTIITVGTSVFEEEELKGYYAKQGAIFSDILDQPLEAIDSWRNAYDVDPSDLKIYEALEKLYTDQEMWEDQVDLLREKAQILEGEKRIETLLYQASVFEEQIGEPLRAKQAYIGILEVDQLHDLAFQKLVEIETEEENWDELNQYYYGRLGMIEDIEQRIDIYRKVADIFEEKLEQPDNAFVVMLRAFQEDYVNDDTAAYLERLASVTGRWEELLQAANQVLAAVEKRDVQISLCLKIGKWYADKLDNPEYALACYQRVLQLDSENATALQLTGHLYRANKQWDEYVEVLKRAVDFEKEDEKRKDLLVELGEVYEEYLGDIPEARTAFQQAVALDPGLEKAIDALERIYGASENWRELITVLRRKIEVLEEPDEIISTHIRIGEIYEDNLDEAQAAVDEYRKALDIEESHVAALKGLERLYDKLERWQDLMDVLEIQLEYASSERERIDLLSRIAEMLEKEFLKPDRAAGRYEEILEIDPAQIESLDALERIYKQTGRWQDLIATLERHIEVVPDRMDRIGFYEQMGDVWASELKDADKAIEMYMEILDIDPDHIDALDNLAQLQAQNEDWGAAHDTLERLAQTVDDPDRKIDLYYRLGKINEENLMNREIAVEHFRSALDVEPGHLQSLEALRKIYLDEGDWVAGARALESEQEYTDNSRKRSKLQYELGALYSGKLGEEKLAVEWYEKALASDPDNQAAADPLVDVYIAEERYAEAEPLLDMLVRLGGRRSSSETQILQRKLGLVADKVGNLDKALKAYQAAYESDTSHLPTLLKLADVYFRKETWDKAFKFYQMVLVHHRDKQRKPEIVEIFYRLGHIKAQVKERRKALNMFDKALEIDPGHVPTLEEVIELHDAGKNFEQVIHFKKELLNAVDEEERFETLVEIGDIWQGKLRNTQKAISAYVEALDIDPDNRPVLHKVLPLYQSTKQWQKVVDIIRRVAEMEEDGEKLGRLYYSMGVIYRDEIKNAEEAVACFNLSLDASITELKAFEAIDRILTQRKDWKNLERAYRKMLHRITGTGRPDLEINLWHFLGEIYRTRMQQFEPAAEAFKMASNLDPDNVVRHEILAELYVSLPGRMDDAVKEYQWMIKNNPYKVESYKALRKLYFDNRQYDKAWCLCATLAFLKKADADEQQFFEQYRAKGMIRAQSRLDNEKWFKYVFHPNESIFVGKILEAVTNVVRSYKVQPTKAFGLKKGQKRPVNDTMMFSKTFFYAAQVLNLPVPPDLYVQEDSAGGLNFAITEPMASVCGASLLSGYSPQDLLFMVTKHLNYYRPEHYIRWVLPTHGELKTLLLAALKIGKPDFNLPADRTGVLDQYVKQLQGRMQPMEREALGSVVKRFLKAGENIDVKKWINAVELTGCRAGFLMCNDLEIAARMVQSESATVDEMPPKEKIKELVVFSVSEEYFKLRETLGITIST